MQKMLKYVSVSSCGIPCSWYYFNSFSYYLTIDCGFWNDKQFHSFCKHCASNNKIQFFHKTTNVLTACVHSLDEP